MNKIICDICGTTYPDTAECCPICGCSSSDTADLLGADVQNEEAAVEADAEVIPVKKKKEIFDFDEVNPDEDTFDLEEEDFEEEDDDIFEAEDDDIDEDEDEGSDDDDDDSDEDDDDAPRSNTFVVILLTVLIVVLLGAAGFIFIRYFLPNMNTEETVPTTEVVLETEAPSATEATIPCQQMFMTSAGVAELFAEGQQFLLHIKVMPEDTTDKIIYTSADESVATVTEDGKITAVSEGETVIYISCGEYFIDCPVIVKYVEETVPPTTEAVVEETAPPVTEAPVENNAEATVATEAPAENNDSTENGSVATDVVLKLKKTDIQLGVYYEYQLQLDCELTPADVTWTSEHPHIATVDEQGNVTAKKEGTTSIIAKYGDQEVQCIIRCGWY